MAVAVQFTEEKWSKHESRSLEEMYDRYAVLAFSLALKILGDRGNAEDVVQETFVTVWKYGGRFDPQRSSERSWVLRMVRQRAIDTLRRQARRPQSDGPDKLIDVASSTDVHKEAVSRLQTAAIRSALDHLPANQRDAINLAYFGGCSQQEIADRLEVPLGTVKGRMRLGLTKLRDLLAVEVAGEPSLMN